MFIDFLAFDFSDTNKDEITSRIRDIFAWNWIRIR
jgi:hypothetical protein